MYVGGSRGRVRASARGGGGTKGRDQGWGLVHAGPGPWSVGASSQHTRGARKKEGQTWNGSWRRGSSSRCHRLRTCLTVPSFLGTPCIDQSPWTPPLILLNCITHRREGPSAASLAASRLHPIGGPGAAWPSSVEQQQQASATRTPPPLVPLHPSTPRPRRPTESWARTGAGTARPSSPRRPRTCTARLLPHASDRIDRMN